MLIGAVLFAFTFWGAIKLVDRYNSRNSLVVAGIIGSFMAFAAPSLGLILIALPLIALMYLLVNYYELGLLRSIAVIVALWAMNLATAAIATKLTALAAAV